MSGIHFFKMHGAGNDFVLIDGRTQSLPQDLTSFVQKTCRRHIGIGADGLMIIDDHSEQDFRLTYYNADGSEGEMCGNGARCAAALAFHLGIAAERMTFEIQEVMYQASVKGAGQVQIAMQPATVLMSAEELQHLLTSEYRTMLLLEVGVPHLVVEISTDLNMLNVEQEGRRLRNHPAFLPRGCNVNFVSRSSDTHLEIRTYERGVEAETQACGTGAVAAATFFQLHYQLSLPLQVQPPGGLLIVSQAEAGCSLIGPATLVFEGDIQLSTYG